MSYLQLQDYLFQDVLLDRVCGSTRIRRARLFLISIHYNCEGLKVSGCRGNGKEVDKWKNIPNSPKLSRTLVPMNAGHLNFNAFIIYFNILITAPGFVTNSFKLPTVKNAFAAPANPPPAASTVAGFTAWA